MEVSGRFAEVWEGLGGFGRVWEGLGGLGTVWKVREGVQGFGRVWEYHNYVTVIENKCLGEFGRIWADLEMPNVCNRYQIHCQRATQATQGAGKECQKGPEDDNMDPI